MIIFLPTENRYILKAFLILKDGKGKKQAVTALILKPKAKKEDNEKTILPTRYAIQAAFPLTKDSSFRLIMPEL